MFFLAEDLPQPAERAVQHGLALNEILRRLLQVREKVRAVRVRHRWVEHERRVARVLMRGWGVRCHQRRWALAKVRERGR